MQGIEAQYKAQRVSAAIFTGFPSDEGAQHAWLQKRRWAARIKETPSSFPAEGRFRLNVTCI